MLYRCIAKNQILGVQLVGVRIDFPIKSIKVCNIKRRIIFIIPAFYFHVIFFAVYFCRKIGKNLRLIIGFQFYTVILQPLRYPLLHTIAHNVIGFADFWYTGNVYGYYAFFAFYVAQRLFIQRV
jgi:hypothetical protein